MKEGEKGWLGRSLGWVNGPSRAVAFAVLLVLIVLFGRDVIASLQVRAEIRNLQKRKTQLEAGITEDSLLLKNLDDPAFLEKYARENYLMRKQGEDVYYLITRP